MKWFRHDSHCSKDAKLDKLLMKYGSEGYGLYWYCIELIAGEVSTENITFEMEHDSEILAYRLKIDTLKVNEILLYCVNLGLFEINPTTKRIMCMALAKRTDEYTSKNPEIVKLQQKLRLTHNVPTKSGDIPIVSDHITLDDTKSNKTKQNKTTIQKTKYLEFVYLTDDQYNELKEKFGEEKLKEKIYELNLGIGSKGYKYSSHYHTILSWDRKNNKQPSPTQGKVDYSMGELSAFKTVKNVDTSLPDAERKKALEEIKKLRGRK